MKVLAKLSSPPSPKRRRAPHPKPPASLVAAALLLGYSGLLGHAILTGSLASLGFQQLLSGSAMGAILGLLAIALSLLSTITAIGVIFIPQRPSLALRLTIIASFSALAVSSILFAAGLNRLLLTGLTLLCFGSCAIALFLLIRWCKKLPRVKRIPRQINRPPQR